MVAIAKVVAPAIYDAIEEKEIASLLLTQHVLPKGESAKYDKVREVKAYWIAKGGQVHQSNINDEEVEFTIDPPYGGLPRRRWIFPFYRTAIFTA